MAARRKRESGGAGALWPAKLGLFLLRAFTGALFLDAVYFKIVVTRMQGFGMSLFEAFDHFVETDYKRMIQNAIDHPPSIGTWEMTWYGDFLEAVMLPGAVPDVMGPAILIFELLLGIALVLGAGVRLMAALGALLMLAFGLAKSQYFLTVTGTNWLLFFVLLFFALAGAGRVWGLDHWLRRKWPAWIS